MRYAGARGQLTVRADSGFYTHAIVAACRRMDVRFSITVRQSASLRSLIEAIPEQDWTPIPYWMEGAADVAETSLHSLPEQARPPPVRLIVRRVKPTPGSQLALFASYSYHGFITDREGETLELGGRPSAPRRDRERHPRPQVRRGVEPSPSGRFAANGAWLAVQVIAHNLARWTARIGLGEQIVTTKDPATPLLFHGRKGSPARRAASLCICPSVGPGKPSSVAPSLDSERCLSPPDGARPPLTRHPAN